MKGSYLRSAAARWQVGGALLLFSIAGPVLATGTIKGTVKPADGSDTANALVYATSDKFIVYHDAVADDGTYSLDVDPGTYTVAIVAKNQDAVPVKDVKVDDGKTVTEDFSLAARKPFPIVKSPAPIPLDQDINSAAFADAPLIDISSGSQVAVGPGDQWGQQGGPAAVSGKFRIKYSAEAIHLAGDVTFKTPKVNSQVDDNLWNGNAIEFDIQNDPYTVDRTDKDADHDWQLVVGLGDKTDWWLHGSVNARPFEPASAHVLRKDKSTGDGELVRIDVPWSILKQGDANGQGITAPADNALGAMDIAVDAADPTGDRASAVRLWQLSWSGFPNGHWDASSLEAVQFVPQAPSTTPTAGP